MLALIAGQGALPLAVARAQDVPPLVWALEGFAPDGLTPDAEFRLETLGSALAALKARGVTQVCLCGRIRRPQIDPARIDAAIQDLLTEQHELAHDLLAAHQEQLDALAAMLLSQETVAEAGLAQLLGERSDEQIDFQLEELVPG